MKEISIKLYTTEIKEINQKNIKSIFIILNRYLSFENIYITIPNLSEEKKYKFSYKNFLEKNWEDIFFKNKIIGFSKKNNELYGGIEIHEQYVSLEFICRFFTKKLGVFKKIILEIVEILNVDCVFVFQENIGINKYYDISYGSHDKGLGIKAGLRDVYWLNYYGKSFAELIGKQKLLDLPVSETKEVAGGVYFKLTGNPEDSFALKDAIKAQIGEQYFVPKDIKGKKHMGNTKERSGIFGLFTHLLHLSKSPENLLVAEKRPNFDKTESS